MMRRLTHLPLAAALVAAAGLYPVAAANAQAAPQTQAPAGQAKDIPEQKLDAAAAAIERMADIKQDYQQRIQKEGSREKQDQLVEEGNNAMQKALTDQGLSPAEYDEILVVAQNNPTVRDKIIERIRSKNGSAGSAPKQ